MTGLSLESTPDHGEGLVLCKVIAFFIAFGVLL